MIATDHAPHSEEEKSVGLEKAPFGVVGLETAFPLMYTNLVKNGIITLSRLIMMMSWSPAAHFMPEGGTLDEGKPADITIVDLEENYKIDSSKFKSKSRNTPFDGWEVYGRVRYTIVDGDVRYEYQKQ